MSPEYFARESCFAFKVAALGQKVVIRYQEGTAERAPTVVDCFLTGKEAGLTAVRFVCCSSFACTSSISAEYSASLTTPRRTDS